MYIKKSLSEQGRRRAEEAESRIKCKIDDGLVCSDGH